MDVKKKRIRFIAIAAVVVVFIVGAIIRFNVEPADYGKTLSKQVKTSKELLSSAKEGNAKGEYSKYTLLEFKQQITDAEKVAKDKDSYYEIEKEACENLKTAEKQFKKSENSDVFSKEEVENAIKNSTALQKTIKFSEYTSLDWTIDGKDIDKAADINLKVDLEGPYYDTINSYMEKYSMQGRVLAFYHNGSLPGTAKITVDYPVESGTAYLYSYNTKTKAFDYVSDVSLADKKASFSVDKGGTYIILTKTIEEYTSAQSGENQTGQEESTVAGQEQTGTQEDSTGAGSSGKQTTNNNTASSNTGSGNTGSGQNGSGQADSGNTITVTIEIRCDTLSNDLSKLTLPSNVDEQQVRSHIPSNGTVLPTTTLKLPTGSTVEYALKVATRNAGIQRDMVYTALYGGMYVKGINYLYEFYAGDNSGWLYKVNNVFPNYGCSKYVLQNGDAIVWQYTCDPSDNPLGMANGSGK
jgi:hypothetical protein